MPARIAGIILPNKPLRVSLRYIYGIGLHWLLKLPS